MSQSELQLKVLVERSLEMHAARNERLSSLVPYPDVRFELAFDSVLLSLEHADAATILISAGLVSSAIALMRTQFECLVRGMWLAYAATDTWVQKFPTPLTEFSASRADGAPMVKDMLDALKHSSSAPQPIIGQINEYKDVTWKALNSFTHGGFHPIARSVTGYPPSLLFNILRNCNAVSVIATQLVTAMTGDENQRDFVRWLHTEYADCLPILSGPVQVVTSSTNLSTPSLHK